MAYPQKEDKIVRKMTRIIYQQLQKSECPIQCLDSEGKAFLRIGIKIVLLLWPSSNDLPYSWLADSVLVYFLNSTRELIPR